MPIGTSAAALLCALACHGTVERGAASAPATLCVTSGAIDAAAGRPLRTASAVLRAVVDGSRGDAIELDFTYDGSVRQSVALASGELREQVGVKLLAADGCNVVYAMWRADGQLVVSVKRNPGQRTHAQCADRGYRRVTARRSRPAPALSLGSRHRLAAALSGTELVLRVDGGVVWEGELGAGDLTALRGPAGLRSDNARMSLHRVTAPLARDRSSAAAGCTQRLRLP